MSHILTGLSAAFQKHAMKRYMHILNLSLLLQSHFHKLCLFWDDICIYRTNFWVKIVSNLYLSIYLSIYIYIYIYTGIYWFSYAFFLQIKVCNVIHFRAGGFSSRLFIVNLLWKKMNWKKYFWNEGCWRGAENIALNRHIYISCQYLFNKEFIKKVLVQVVLHALWTHLEDKWCYLNEKLV